MDLYDRIVSLCQAHQVRPGKMCGDLGLSRGLMTDLKMGRKKMLSAETLSKIASYFGVSVDSLLNEDALTSSAVSGEEENVLILARKRKTLTPEQLHQVMEMTRVLFGDDFWEDEDNGQDQ